MFSYMEQEQGFYHRAIRLTLPIMLQNIITSTLTMADTFMVGLLGTAQMAALTLANIPIFVLQLFLFGVQSGASILISQYWGKHDHSAIRQVLGVSLWLSFGVTSCFSLLMFFFPQEFLSLFGNDPQVIALAAGYGELVGFSFLLNGFTLMYVGAYRSMGKPQLGMYMLGASMLVNLFFNWVFIYGNLGAPALGVRGAAVATLLARGLELVILILHITFSKGFPLKWKELLFPQKSYVKKFVKHGTPVVLNETCWGLGTAMFPSIIGHMAGSREILAAYAIATNIERLVMVMGFGIASSSGILVGNAMGAGMSREKVLNMGLCLSTLGFLSGLFSGLVLLLLSVTLMPLWVAPTFQLDAVSSDIAQMMLVFLSLFMSFRTLNTVAVVGVFRGGGDTKRSMQVDLIPLWVLAIPLSFLAGSVLKLSIFWVMLAIQTETVVKGIVAIYFLRKASWMHDLTQSQQ